MEPQLSSTTSPFAAGFTTSSPSAASPSKTDPAHCGQVSDQRAAHLLPRWLPLPFRQHLPPAARTSSG
ncbi:unnamed protein product [Urochloa humidicola]